jgi:hypothetical protein
MIRFSEITIDEHYRTRPDDAEDIARIVELIGLGEYPPPVTVCKAGESYLLLDGFDRYSAWRRALSGHATEIRVLIAECPDEDSRFRAAIGGNMNNGRNYTIAQIGALNGRLTRELGFSKAEARKLLRLTDEHAEKLDRPPVRMEATSEPVEASEPVKVERADSKESPAPAERPLLHEIHFHVERLRKLVPPAWVVAHRSLETLADEIITAIKNEEEKTE